MTDFAHPKLISVVVIGRNEGERLGRCLRSIRSQIQKSGASTPPSRQPLLEDRDSQTWVSTETTSAPQTPFNLELLYVDSNSTDSSVALATDLGAKVIALHPVRPTAALGRNAGWRVARGEIILFLDGDTELDPNFIAAALPAFADPKTAVVWGHRREKQPFVSTYDRTLDLDWMYPPGLSAFCGGDALFRRDVLEQTGGFDDALIAGEEPELCGRLIALGFQVLHIDVPMTQHVLGIRGFGQYWKRATRAGHAYAEVAARFAGTANPLWTDDLRRNRVRAGFLVGLPIAATAFTILLWSRWPSHWRPSAWQAGFWWPALGTATIFSLLVLRTAWKARWKSSSPVTLLLYGIHSHFQQLPIAWGQLQFAANHRRGRRANVFDYKRRS